MRAGKGWSRDEPEMGFRLGLWSGGRLRNLEPPRHASKGKLRVKIPRRHANSGKRRTPQDRFGPSLGYLFDFRSQDPLSPLMALEE